MFELGISTGFSLGCMHAGGFSSFLLGMDWTSYLQSDGGAATPDGIIGMPPQNLPPNVVEPNLGKLIGFMFVIAFSGVLVLVPLRKVSA